jgi:hypothetical protein
MLCLCVPKMLFDAVVIDGGFYPLSLETDAFYLCFGLLMLLSTRGGGMAVHYRPGNLVFVFCWVPGFRSVFACLHIGPG